MKTKFYALAFLVLGCSTTEANQTKLIREFDGYWKSFKETQVNPKTKLAKDVADPVNNFHFANGKVLNFWTGIDTTGLTWLPYSYNEKDSLLIIGGISNSAPYKVDVLRGGNIYKAYFSSDSVLVLQGISSLNPPDPIGYFIYLKRKIN